MKTRNWLFALTVLVFATLACATLSSVGGSGNVIKEKRDVGEFNGIHLNVIGDIVLEQGDMISLEIETDDNILPLIETKVENGILVITKPGTEGVSPSNGLTYYVTVKELESLVATGSTRVKSGAIKADNLKIKSTGAGIFEFTSIEADSLDITISGSGIFSVDEMQAQSVNVVIDGAGRCDLKSGKVGKQTITISRAGTYFAENTESETTVISIQGAATVKVWATQTLEVDIQRAGTVFYKGDPEVSTNINGAGNVKRIP